MVVELNHEFVANIIHAVRWTIEIIIISSTRALMSCVVLINLPARVWCGRVAHHANGSQPRHGGGEESA